MNRGGKRIGAGRPAGKGPWGEKTLPMRIPLSLVEGVTKFLEQRGYDLPLYVSKVPAGPPSEAINEIEELTDLNAILVSNSKDCFLLRVTGDSMDGACIHDGDILVVDRSVKPAHNKIVVAMIDGQVTVKRLDMRGDIIQLKPENENYRPIPVTDPGSFIVSGVVVAVGRKI